MTDFVVDFQRSPYIETGQTGAYPNRLNWRCELLLTRNRAAIQNKRVLDIACHDGRFSYACLQLGAKHVTGVEGRPDLVKSARNNLQTLGYSSDTYEIMCDDIFNKIREFRSGDFDLILCFGFFYHTIRQIELLQEIQRLKPDYFILDTTVYKEPFHMKVMKKLTTVNSLLSRLPGKRLLTFSSPPQKYMVFRKEDHRRPSNTIDTSDIIGIPTTSLVELLLDLHGFNFTQIMWDNNNIHDWKDIVDYKDKTRVSYIATRNSK